MENPEKPLVKIVSPDDGIKYDPNRLDIMEFDLLYHDASLHRGLCAMASRLGTTVSYLWGTILAHALERAGEWSPATPKELPCRVHVKVRDLQDNPKALLLGPNRITQGHMLKQGSETPTESGPDPNSLDFLDED